MNLSGLSRLLLSSVLALFLVGGMMTSNAQTVVVDQDGGEDELTIQEGLTALNGQVGSDGVGTLVVVAGDYTSDGTIQFDATDGATGDGDAATDNLAEVTFEVRRDDDSDVDELTIEALDLENGIDVILNATDGTEFVQVQAGGGNELDLNDETLLIESSVELRLAGGSDIFRSDTGAIDGSGTAPVFQGSVNLTYNNSAGSITAGLEAPSNLNGGTLTINDGGSGNRVTFNNDLTAATFNYTGGDVRFAGNFTVGSNFTVSDGDEFEVDGTLTFTNVGPLLTVNGNGTSPEGTATLGNMTATWAAGNAGSDIIEADGLVNIGTLTVNLDALVDNATNEEFDADIEADGSSSNLTISSVNPGSISDSDETDEVAVDVDNDNDGAVSVGGTLHDLNNASASSSLTLTGSTTVDGTFNNSAAGSVTVSGQTTYDIATSTSPINNSGGGTITVNNGAALTVDDTGDGGQSESALNNSDANGLTGQGFLVLTGDSGDDFTLDTQVGQNQELGNVRANVPVDILDDAGSATAVNMGSLEANAVVDVGDASTGDVEFGNVTVNANVNFGDGSSGSVGTITLATLEVNSGTIDFTAVDPATDNVDTQAVGINSGGTVDITGTTLQINQNFTRESATDALLTTDNSSNIEFIGSNDAIFDSGSIFTINGKILVDKPNGSLTMEEAIRVNGDFEVTSSSNFVVTEFIMNDFLQMGATAGQTTAAPQAGTFTASSKIETTGNFALMFTPSGGTQYTIAGTDTLDNVIIRNDVAGGNQDVDVTDNVEFKGTLTLRSGGIDGVGDLSPVGDEAQVVRWITSTNTSFDGSFNADQNAYDLLYTRSGTNPTASELTDEVRNLTVDAGAQPQLNDSYDVNGVLTVNGTIGNDNVGSTARTLFLTANDSTHSIAGIINDAADDVTLQVDGNNATIEGDASSGTVAEVQNVVIAGEGATITDLQRITGTLNVNQGGDLSLGLANPDAGDRTVAENVTLSDSLSLDTDVSVTSSDGNDDVLVNSTGGINFASSDLTITGGGADFDGNADATYYSSGGSLVFDGGSNPTFGTDGESVPRVVVDDAIALSENVATSDLLDMNDDVNLAGFNFEFADAAEMDADVNDSSGSNTGVFRAIGTTMTLEDNVAVTRFDVATSEDSTVYVRSDDPSSARTLELDIELILTGGWLDHGQNEIEVEGPTVTADSADVTSSTGFLVLETDDAGGAISVTTGPTPDDTLSIANLWVDDMGDTSDDASFGADGLNLEITNELQLDGTFDGSTGDGDVVIADGTLIDRQTSSSVLTEELSFAGMYNLEFNVSSNTTSGFELDDSDDTVNDLTVNNTGVAGSNTVTFAQVNNGPQGDVVVNGTIHANDGFIAYPNRQLRVADGALFRQSTNEGIVGGSSTPAIVADGDYWLQYDNTNIVTSSKEFLDGAFVRVGFVNAQGNRSAGTMTLNANRTAGTLLVEAATTNNNNAAAVNNGVDLNGNALTVDSATVVNSADVGNGTLDADGDLTLNAGAIQDPDINFVGGNGVSRTTVLAAADVNVNGGSLGTNTDLTYDGEGEQALALSGSESLTQLTLGQSDVNGTVPRVVLSGGNLSVNVVNFGNGLFETGDNRISIGAFSRAGVGDGDASHVVGTVRQFIAQGGAGTGRFEYPVGTDTSQTLDMPRYRPYTLTFDGDDPPITNTNIDVRHVDENPMGRVGLPFTDSLDVATGNYPDFYWLVQATTSLGARQEFDIELVGENLGVPFEDEEDLRIIRRFDGNADENEWKLQGDAVDYDNILEVQGEDSTVTVRNIGSQGGLVTQATRVTIGIPSRAPAFSQAPAAGDTLTVAEDSTLLVNFEAEGRDIGSDLSFSMDNTPDNATFSSTSDSTATFEFTPDFDQQGLYNPIANVTDNNNGLTTSRSFFVDVQDNTPSFILGSPSGDSLCTAGDVSLVLQESIGLENSPLLPFSLSQRLAADVSGDGEVNAGDASIIKQYVAGLRDSFPAGTPGCSRANGSSTNKARIAADMSQVNGTVGFGSLTNGEDGQTHMPVELTGDVRNVRSVQVTANYDASAMTIEDVTSSLPEGWQMVHRVDEDNGIVMIAMAGAEAAPAGKIADLAVSIDDNASSTTIEGSVLLNTSTETALNAKSVSAIPGSFALEANRPNPVQTSTTIEYSLPEQADVTLEVYNVLGQRVATLVNEKKSAGTYQVNFDASDLSSGVYMYRIEAGTFSESSRMTVIR